MEKGPYRIFSKFHFKTFITQKVLNFGTNIGMNNILSSCYNQEFQAPPISGMGEANARINRVPKSPLYASLWQLAAWDRRLGVASNCGSVKYKAQTAYKLSGMALKW